MYNRDKRTDGRTHVQKAFYNLPSAAGGRYKCRIYICKYFVNSERTNQNGQILQVSKAPQEYQLKNFSRNK